MSAEELGPLMRLWGLTTAQLPPTTATADELAPFLISLLQEAVPFINSVAPKDDAGRSGRNTKLWKSKGSKSYSESSAKVELYERVVPASELEIVTARAYDDANPATHRAKVASETWVCRRSVHADSATTGTASWAEFLDCFKDRHAETEDAFTPAIVGAREAMTWDCGGVEADEGGETWGRFTLKVEEMKHKIGAPLNDRVFAVLQMTCAAVAAPAKSEFLVVSVPVMDFGKVAQAHFAKEKGVVLGAYVSVERIRKLPGVDGDIEWLMATASDARGVLPMWVQTLAVPGQIAKDVSLFLGWIAKERTGGTHVSSVEPNKSEDTEGRQGVQTEVPAASEGAA